MKVFLLTAWTPHDGVEQCGVFSTRQLAAAEAERYKRMVRRDEQHQYLDIDEVEVDAHGDYLDEEC